MFCSKCGSEVPANSKFCPKCGAPTPQQAAPQPQPAPAPASGPAPGPTPGSAPISQPKKISTKAVGIGIGVIAVIVVAVVLFGVFGVFGGGKPEDVARQDIEAQLNGDPDKVYSLISPDVSWVRCPTTRSPARASGAAPARRAALSRSTFPARSRILPRSSPSPLARLPFPYACLSVC